MSKKDIIDLLATNDSGVYHATISDASPPMVQEDFSTQEMHAPALYIAPDRKTKKTKKRMDFILEKFRLGASVGATCKAAEITVSTLYYWRKNDRDFDQACEDAWQEGTSIYEEEIYDRAKNGTVADVYHQGLVVGQRVEHHDPLLLRTVERREPESWGKATQRIELTGKDGGAVRVATLDLTKSVEELAALGHSPLIEEYRALLEKQQKPSGGRGE